MQKLRFWLICLLLFIGFALNIERLDIGEAENVVDLASFIYVLSGLAIVTTIMLPQSWKLSTTNIVLFWVVIYFLIKLVFLKDHPLLGGIYTLLSIVELVVLVILVLLTRKVLENLQGLEDVVANITLADVSNRVKSLDEAMQEISKEFARSRRYKRPLSVVVIKLKPENIQANTSDLSQDIIRTMMSRYSMSNLIRAIDKVLRRSDLILEQSKDNRVILLLPEANEKAAQAVSTNIQNLILDKIGTTVDIGFAMFPDDAIIFEDLVTHAESAMVKLEKGSNAENQNIDEQSEKETDYINSIR